jgi:hypothetical protein
LGGNRRNRRRSRIGCAALVAALTALSMIALGCGGGDSSGTEEAAGAFRVSIVTDEFPAKQRLGETTLMRLGIRNDGDERLPALVVGVTVGGEQGLASSLPFGIRSEEPGLAQPDRPVWVLSHHYPKLAGSDEPGGAEGSDGKSYNFGPLEPGETTEAVWKLTATRTGRFNILYKVDAGLSAAAKAETRAGSQPRGSFAATISDEPPDTIVTDSGEVVEIDQKPSPAR